MRLQEMREYARQEMSEGMIDMRLSPSLSGMSSLTRSLAEKTSQPPFAVAFPTAQGQLFLLLQKIIIQSGDGIVDVVIILALDPWPPFSTDVLVF